MLTAKLHQARVTHANPDYDGSCAIDDSLLQLAGMREYEQIQIYNITNGHRFTTYVIQAEAGSGIISVNGAAAHLASPKDKIIICSYGQLSEQEAIDHKPRLVYLDEDNQVMRTANAIPVQSA
jgi:aspartate 1-decarboxylase